MPAAAFAFCVQRCDSLPELWEVLEAWSKDQPFHPIACHVVVRRYRRIRPPERLELSSQAPEELDPFAHAKLLAETMAGDLAVSNPIAFAWDALVEAELLADRKIDGLFPAAFKRLVFSPAIAADGNIGLFTFILRPSHPALSPEALAEIEFVCQYIYRRAIALTRREFDVRLSPREVEIASRMASGKSNRVIAAELGVSSNTVDTMVRRIFTKLNVDNRVEAALECVTHQLIQL